MRGFLQFTGMLLTLLAHLPAPLMLFKLLFKEKYCHGLWGFLSAIIPAKVLNLTMQWSLLPSNSSVQQL